MTRSIRPQHSGQHRPQARTFWKELQSRRVYRTALGYIVGASAIVQVVGTVFPIFHVADWIQQVSVVLLALGFPVALVLAWVFEIEGGSIRRTRSLGGSRSAINRRRLTILAATGLLLAGVAVAGYWWWHPWRRPAATANVVAAPDALPLAEKSIAVLPFANLSDLQQNAFFADGVQDEILNDLAKIGDLKVISRTSVMQYQSGVPRNLREIGQQLGVAHVLEGSVRRQGDRVRVSAQLIDARTDTQVWGEQYERKLEDVFLIQSEIAQAIVTQLQARLSPREKADIEQRPTRDLVAYDLYLQARDAVNSYLNADDPQESLSQAVRFLEEAVARDPQFALAYCYIARAHSLLFFLDFDPTPARRLQAENAVKTALRLPPDSAEAHLALADFRFRCERDYNRAQEALAMARPNLPNSVPFFVLSAYIDRRQGRWEEAERDFVQAMKLDPLNPNAVNLLVDTYVLLRRFDEGLAAYDRAIAAGMRQPILFVRRAAIEFAANGDRSTLEAALANAPTDLDVGGGETAWRVMLALIARDYDRAESALRASPRSEFQEVDFTYYYPRPWYEALIARARGDQTAAQTAFAAARPIFEARLKLKPDDARTLSVMAQVDAGLGRKGDAIAEAKRAVELMPMSKDAYDAPLVRQGLAQVYTWTGEADLALETVGSLLAVPGYLCYGYLKLDPAWEPLRHDSRFQDLIASLAPRPR